MQNAMTVTFFVTKMQKRIGEEKGDLNIPNQQKRPIEKPFPEIAAQYKDLNAAIIAAYKTGAYSRNRGCIQRRLGLFFARTRILYS